MNQPVIMHTEPGERAQPSPSAPAQEATELLNAYPNLSEVELARLINLYSKLSALDVALMISDERLGPRMDRFFADHRAKIRTPFQQYAILVVIAVVGVIALFWSMEIAS